MSLQDINNSIAMVERNVRESENWKTTVGKFVQLNYVPGSIPKGITLERTVKLMDLAAANDCYALQLVLPSKPIPVYLYPNEDALRTALAMKGISSTGVSLGSWAVIVSKPNLSYGQLANDSAHEIGHAIVHENLGLFVGPFMAEGIAYYLEGKFSSAPWIKKPAPVEATPVTTLIDQAKTYQDYQQGARFCAYLLSLDNGKPERLKLLFKGLHQTRLNLIRHLGAGTWPVRANRVFTDLFHQSLSQLDAGWHRRFKK